MPKIPKTDRGRATRKKVLDAALIEFGERGFRDASISGITRRAGVALGTFYVYFNSKEEVFRDLVAHMNHETRAFIASRIEGIPGRLEAERVGLEAFLEFSRANKHLYRIVMEAQFVAPDAYRAYYDAFVQAYRDKLEAASANGEIRPGHEEELAWALVGMHVFLGLRYAVWDDTRPVSEIAAMAADFIAHGLAFGLKPDLQEAAE